MIVYVPIHPGEEKHKEHSTNHQPTQAHMEDGLCPAHSLLSWHTHYQLTKEFHSPLGKERNLKDHTRPAPTRPAPTGFSANYFFPCSFFPPCLQHMTDKLNITQVHGQEERAKKETRKELQKVPTSALVDTFQPLQVVAVVVFVAAAALSHSPQDFTKGKTGSAFSRCSCLSQTTHSLLTSAPGAAGYLLLLLSSTSGEEHLAYPSTWRRRRRPYRRRPTACSPAGPRRATSRGSCARTRCRRR
jgi:hypothetical protein